MVHAIQHIKCENGHPVIGFDSNECGCHHKGNPCIIIFCDECLKDGKAVKIEIPIHPDYVDEVKAMLIGSKTIDELETARSENTKQIKKALKKLKDISKS